MLMVTSEPTSKEVSGAPAASVMANTTSGLTTGGMCMPNAIVGISQPFWRSLKNIGKAATCKQCATAFRI